VTAAGLQAPDPRTIAILSFALCGFANFASLAVLSGGLSARTPNRRTAEPPDRRAEGAGMLTTLN
jgi:CNT family concentrative nucleoside transporter